MVVEERKRRMASLQTWASTRRRPQPTIIRPREQKKVDAAVAKYKKEYAPPPPSHCAHTRPHTTAHTHTHTPVADVSASSQARHH
jgi:hypothetical protein